MSKKGDSGGRRRIGAGAKAEFLAALRAGKPRDEAAAQAGFTSQSFYYARRRDAVFRLGWIWALELSAADERGAHKASTLNGPGWADVEITPNNKRLLQCRRIRAVRFTAARKKIAIDRFAGTADAFAAAEAAGVHYSTLQKHYRADPAFAADWDEALRQAYATLEAEAVRQRLEAQRRLREDPNPTGELAKEFERVMQLLARLDRRDGRAGMRQARQGRLRRWTFEEAIHVLDKKLRALGVRRGVLPPGDEGELS